MDTQGVLLIVLYICNPMQPSGDNFLNKLNKLVFAEEKCFVFNAVRTESLNII